MRQRGRPNRAPESHAQTDQRIEAVDEAKIAGISYSIVMRSLLIVMRGFMPRIDPFRRQDGV